MNAAHVSASPGMFAASSWRSRPQVLATLPNRSHDGAAAEAASTLLRSLLCQPVQSQLRTLQGGLILAALPEPHELRFRYDIEVLCNSRGNGNAATDGGSGGQGHFKVETLAEAAELIPLDHQEDQLEKLAFAPIVITLQTTRTSRR